MKYRLLYVFALSVVVGAAAGAGFAQNRPSIKTLHLTLSSSRDTFSLGEPIPLRAELYNSASEEAILLDTFDPVYGSLKILSRKESGTAVEYMNPEWGILEENGTTKIKANGSLTRDFQLVARQQPENSVEFFFTEEGTYKIRISYLVRPAGAEKMSVIESDPITITITEPQGEDLAVWNLIKDNGEVANFIQEADFRIPVYKTAKRELLEREIAAIVDKFPDSLYSQMLRNNLAKFRAEEQKRKAAVEKLKRSQ